MTNQEKIQLVKEYMQRHLRNYRPSHRFIRGWMGEVSIFNNPVMAGFSVHFRPESSEVSVQPPNLDCLTLSTDEAEQLARAAATAAGICKAIDRIMDKGHP